MEENINYDERAAEYIEAVKKYNPEPTWDLMHTAYVCGATDTGGEWGDWQTRLKAEQASVKNKLAKLTDFINSEKFYELSNNNRLLLKNQKIAMELYLNVLNMRVFEDVDKIIVPDYSMMQVMGSVFGNTMMQPLKPISDKVKLIDQESVDTDDVNIKD